MISVEQEIQRVLDQDPEIEKFAHTANQITNSFWDTTAKEMAETKESKPYFKRMSGREFAITYKVMLAWAVTITKILLQIHGEDSTDWDNGIDLGKDNQRVVICHLPKPWQMHFRMEQGASGETLYIAEDIVLLKKDTTGIVSSSPCIINFTLESPSVTYIPARNLWVGNLAQSIMSIKIIGVRSFKVVVPVEHFTKDFFVQTILKAQANGLFNIK